MGKNPAFLFYPMDWDRDLGEHPLEIEGAWIRICNKLFWSKRKGELTRTLRQWAQILRVDETNATRILDYIKKWDIGTVVTDGNGEITVTSRRIVRDEKEKENNRKRQERYRERQKSGRDITDDEQKNNSPSSVSVSDSIKKTIAWSDEAEAFVDIQAHDKARWKKAYPAVDIDQEIAKAESWVVANPKNKKSNWPRFLNAWMKRAQDNAPARGKGDNGIQPPRAVKPRYICQKCDDRVTDVIDYRGQRICEACMRKVNPELDPRIKQALQGVGKEMR